MKTPAHPNSPQGMPAAPAAAAPSAFARALMAMVRAYQVVISPSLGQHCRFSPSCSAYGLQALQQHGAVGGSYLTLSRLARCHPWCAGGHDPVPHALAKPVFFSRFFHDSSSS